MFDNRQDEANEELERRMADGEPMVLNVPPGMTDADWEAFVAEVEAEDDDWGENEARRRRAQNGRC